MKRVLFVLLSVFAAGSVNAAPLEDDAYAALIKLLDGNQRCFMSLARQALSGSGVEFVLHVGLAGGSRPYPKWSKEAAECKPVLSKQGLINPGQIRYRGSSQSRRPWGWGPKYPDYGYVAQSTIPPHVRAAVRRVVVDQNVEVPTSEENEF